MSKLQRKVGRDRENFNAFYHSFDQQSPHRMGRPLRNQDDDETDDVEPSKDEPEQ